MPTVQKHTQTTSDKIKTISAADADRIFADKSIGRDKNTVLVQFGSVQLGTSRYVVFPTAFSDVPSVSLTRLGSVDMSAFGPVSGSAPLEGIHQIVAGSFSCYGTPTSYFLWQAQGSA
jgi:hypothetical protein